MEAKSIIIIVFTLIFSVLLVALSISNEPERSNVSYSPQYHFDPAAFHYKFRIEGDEELLRFLRIHNVSGKGMLNDPYVISYLDISKVQGGIYIANTSLYVVFEDVNIHSPLPGSVLGVAIVNSKHIKFVNCTVKNDMKKSYSMGFYIKSSTDISIENFEFDDFTGKHSGIWIINSEHIHIRNTTQWNSRIGIWMTYSSNSSMRNLYITKGTGVVIGFSENISIYGSRLYATGVGVELVSSYDCRIRNNSFIENYEGIHSIDGNENSITDNSFLYSEYGIYMCGINSPTHHNIIRGNLFAYNQKYGIYLTCDGSNFIYENVFLNSTVKDEGYHRGSPYWNYPYAEHSLWNFSNRGNYWYSWANKNDTNDRNHDGIVDYPYPILGKTVVYDNHPLKIAPFSYALIPSSPRNFTVEVQGKLIILKWQTPKYLSSQVMEYRIYKDGKLMAITSANKTTYKRNVESADGIYYVTAVDKYKRESSISHSVVINQGNDFQVKILLILISIIIPLILVVIALISERKKDSAINE
ncbi:MAG: right-handed parallel beta-helix repeat-containing protein [Thermoplasmata archaeon]|nr:right-handed parallel beta-helix repeat-containing protein [Thermoplasmata archaeon]